MAKKSVPSGSPVIIDTVQIALFPNDFNIENASELQAELLDEDFIKSDKLIINTFPKDFPRDVVRIDAQLKKFDVNIKIAPAKISLYWTNKLLEKDYRIGLEQIYEVLAETNRFLLRDRIFKRVGYITTIYKKTSNPDTIIRKIIALRKKETLRDGQLVFTYDWKLDNTQWAKDIRFNKRITIATGLVQKTDRAIIIQYDLNTHQSCNVGWGLKEISDFLDKSYSISSSPEKIYSEFF